MRSRSRESARPARTSLSPNQRAWRRFRRNRLGFVSLIVLAVMLLIGTLRRARQQRQAARRALSRATGSCRWSAIRPRRVSAATSSTPTDWHDPFIRAAVREARQLRAVHAEQILRATPSTTSTRCPPPRRPAARTGSAPTRRERHDRAPAVRLSRQRVVRPRADADRRWCSASSWARCKATSADGWTSARSALIEIWNAIPELYLLIIIASIFEPSMLLLLGVFALFGWICLSDYVRAEFLRNRNLEFVKAARAMGLSNAQIIWRHLLPNSMTPVITFLPFRMSAAILFLAGARFPRPRRHHVGVAGRSPAPGQGQPRRVVDLGADLPAARAHAAPAHVHRRRAARRLRHAQVMTGNA